MQLQAAVLEQTGAPLRVRTINSRPLQTGQVLVRILYSGVCRSQLMEVRGGRGVDRWLPHLLGHEASGIVQAVGSGVSKVQVGDGVILTWLKGEGIEAPGALYDADGQTINSGPVTTFSNYSVVSENRLVRKPEALPFDTAVLFGCALPTGMGMALNELSIGPAAQVVVLGLGGIGLSALLALRAQGLTRIIAVDRSPEKLQAAADWGVEHCLDAGRPDLLETVTRLTGGGADFCIEAAGQVSTIELGFALIRKGGGQLLFASHPPNDQTIRLSPHDLISGKRIAGSWGGGVQPDRDLPRFHQLLSRADLPLDSLLARRYRLAQINEALEDLEAGRVFRPLIEMEHGSAPGALE